MRQVEQNVPLAVPGIGPCAVRTWLHVPHGPDCSTLQILVSGSTYSHLYWDWPTSPEYSYVRFMADRGHATLSFDRLGIGSSSHPPGDLVTIEAQSAVVHHLVGMARSGSLSDQRFERVVLVGHSLGSLIAGTAAARYRDVDAVIETGASGFAMAVEDGDPRVSQGWMRPASEDPKFEHSDRGDHYFTTPPGMRQEIFFWEPRTESKVIDDDERLKETMTSGEISQLGSMSELLSDVRVPVLCVAGEHDLIVSALGGQLPVPQVFENAEREAPGPNFSFVVIPEMGHNLNQHRQAVRVYGLMAEWIEGLVALRPGLRGGSMVASFQQQPSPVVSGGRWPSRERASE